MLPTELCPFCELVLAAGRVELVPSGQVFCLLLSLLGILLGDGEWEACDKAPQLISASGQHFNGGVEGGKELTRPLIVPAPIVLTS